MQIVNVMLKGLAHHIVSILQSSENMLLCVKSVHMEICILLLIFT